MEGMMSALLMVSPERVLMFVIDAAFVAAMVLLVCWVLRHRKLQAYERQTAERMRSLYTLPTQDVFPTSRDAGILRPHVVYRYEPSAAGKVVPIGDGVIYGYMRDHFRDLIEYADRRHIQIARTHERLIGSQFVTKHSAGTNGILMYDDGGLAPKCLGLVYGVGDSFLMICSDEEKARWLKCREDAHFVRHWDNALAAFFRTAIYHNRREEIYLQEQGL